MNLSKAGGNWGIIVALILFSAIIILVVMYSAKLGKLALLFVDFNP